MLSLRSWPVSWVESVLIAMTSSFRNERWDRLAKAKRDNTMDSTRNYVRFGSDLFSTALIRMVVVQFASSPLGEAVVGGRLGIFTGLLARHRDEPPANSSTPLMLRRIPQRITG